jgi:hypothetical protein
MIDGMDKSIFALREFDESDDCGNLAVRANVTVDRPRRGGTWRRRLSIHEAISRINHTQKNQANGSVAAINGFAGNLAVVIIRLLCPAPKQILINMLQTTIASCSADREPWRILYDYPECIEIGHT